MTAEDAGAVAAVLAQLVLSHFTEGWIAVFIVRNGAVRIKDLAIDDVGDMRMGLGFDTSIDQELAADTMRVQVGPITVTYPRAYQRVLRKWFLNVNEGYLKLERTCSTEGDAICGTGR